MQSVFDISLQYNSTQILPQQIPIQNLGPSLTPPSPPLRIPVLCLPTFDDRLCQYLCSCMWPTLYPVVPRQPSPWSTSIHYRHRLRRAFIVPGTNWSCSPGWRVCSGGWTILLQCIFDRLLFVLAQPLRKLWCNVSRRRFASSPRQGWQTNYAHRCPGYLCLDPCLQSTSLPGNLYTAISLTIQLDVHLDIYFRCIFCVYVFVIFAFDSTPSRNTSRLLYISYFLNRIMPTTLVEYCAFAFIYWCKLKCLFWCPANIRFIYIVNTIWILLAFILAAV